MDWWIEGGVVCRFVHSLNPSTPLTHIIVRADPDKWREVMMENAKLLYAAADNDKGKKKGGGGGREEL